MSNCCELYDDTHHHEKDRKNIERENPRYSVSFNLLLSTRYSQIILIGPLAGCSFV
jgi:hypothetical protein